VTLIADNLLVTVSPPWQQRLSWPVAEPPDSLPYSLDLTAAIADAGDTLSRATASVAPSGTGEMAVVAVGVNGSIVTSILAGGQPGRIYFVGVIAYTSAGRVLSFFVELPLSLDESVSPIPPPPSPGFGPVVSS